MNNIRFLTGCKLLDMCVGGDKGVYGFPAGRFVNIVGDKSSGKTFLANEIIATAFYHFPKEKFKWIYDDCEAGYSFDTVSMYGFDVLENANHSTTVEEASCNIRNFAEGLESDQFGIYVLDSLDALTCSEQDNLADERLKQFNAGKTLEKGSYGMGKQKFLSQEFFPQLCSTIQDKNVLVVIISQVRDNIEPFSFEKYSRSGGKALDFYAHTVLWLATLKKIKKRDMAVGSVVKAKVTKSKTPRPFRECVFSFIFDYGVDDIGASLDYLFDLRTPQGELNANAKNIDWNAGNEKITVSSVKKWLEDIDMLSECVSSLQAKRNGLESYLSWIDENKNRKVKGNTIKQLFDEKFGTGKSRTELITYIEENNLQKELSERVEAKWEAVEESLKSGRKKKYATIPEGGQE